jgi:membrane protein YqaA with SNARE-associated domain
VLGDGSRDAGIVVWGNVAGGMLKYYLGVSDGRFDRRGRFFSFEHRQLLIAPVPG